ncbi:XRE family transcriptional regulator [Streptomyces sp. TRM S81-3]|uniref:XRE family transcriptional regulator n=1 Tax=Streptomyces griseicoloratus TaxID=2752516 RepID=A0A926KXE4_9ACTN|nr:XRE family transcriptional regulator [Streptomyces griseicoloratus]MBD0417980.1 XRE family transcriptional regulator [Streptomyces griseicoloratus]
MSQKGVRAKSPQEPSQPAYARTPAEFTEALRALRIRSGLTYRQLEDKAGAHGDPLPASTIASTLGRTSLPRERFVEAFTRACGLGEEEVGQWLAARHRIATQVSAPTGDEAGDAGGTPVPATDAPARARAPRWRRTAALLGAACIVAAGTLGLGSRLEESAPDALPTMPVTGLRMLAVGSWARIHPARTPELCLTEGRDRTSRYRTAVATQRPCEEAGLPQVYLEPVGKNTVQIQWHHPKYGIGCLTVLSKGPARNLLEPRDDCADDNRAQQFRIESFGPRGTARFLIRPAVTGQCLSLRDQDTEEGTEIVQGRCSGAADQDFLIELIRPPLTVAAPKKPGTN